jgi:hypothetical protein
MDDWQFVQTEPSEQFAKVHYFCFKKHQTDGDIEFVITVKEFAGRNPQHMRFFAQADKEVNQKTAPFVPFGWGDTLLQAVSECVKSIRRYPYER